MDEIHFGTDGWRAVIGEDFTEDNLVRVAEAAALAFKENAEKEGAAPADKTVIVGYDCRINADEFAKLAAEVVAAFGFDVKLSDAYCPTPTLCWSVSKDPDAIGGLMLTSSHNAAYYLGVKLRMEDGGASPKEFTDRVEELLPDEPTAERGEVKMADLMGPYLSSLREWVDTDAISKANLRVVVDPLYGAGRLYLSGLLRGMGVEVEEIHNADDPTFQGLHPEPVPPWVDEGLKKVAELRYDALFVNDGDADRIAGGDCDGNFVNPHKILALVTEHLVRDRHETGKVVSTVTASATLDRLCRLLGLELVSTPVGFKWIYEEMEKGGVLVGGEESGGIGIPGHVKERDGLLMALLLTETMAQRGKDLKGLVDDLAHEVGTMEFTRKGVSLTPEEMQEFKDVVLPEFEATGGEFAGRKVLGYDRRDGVKLLLEGDEWVMMRPSGTEPLVRIYAEAASSEGVDELLDAAEAIIKKDID
ncbi:MAG: phosphoglucosamine mutase [Eggerthellaceae bacterium]|nr:phosphoglucosamine mutase [Eggerthellaceae bacterium]